MRTVNTRITADELRALPEAHKGARVIVGGEILATQPRADGTEVELLTRRLRGDDSPERSDRSPGRVLLRARDFLDPAVYAPGRRITVIGEHTEGTYCELKAIPASQLAPLDDALSFEEGAAFPLVFETAYRMLVTKARLQEGEWVLIWGIGGGVALAAFEIARAVGARTIVTSSSSEKLERARELGADVTVDHHVEDVVAAVKEATEGRGADVVVETVGEATWERSLSAAGFEGRIVVCGATSGHSPPARLYRFWWKQLVLYGSSMGMSSDFEGAYDLIRSGKARVHVDSVFPLAEAARAHERLESGAQFGKVVLRIPD